MPRPLTQWMIATALAALLLLGLCLPHHHEDHAGETHRDCAVCKLQSAAGSGWSPAPAPVTVDLRVTPCVLPQPGVVILRARRDPQAPRAPPAA